MIRAAVVLVLLARAAWAAPAPAPAQKQPAPAQKQPAPAQKQPAPAQKQPAPADEDPDPIVKDEPDPDPAAAPKPDPAAAPKPDPAAAPKPDPAAEPAPAAGARPASAATFGVTPPPADMIRENSLLIGHARAARDAASSGNCDVVSELSPKVRALDPTFHDQIFTLDPLIAACLTPGARPRAARRTKVVLREVHADPPPSAGRVAGELLLGMVVGAGGALIGALIGGPLCIGGNDDDTNCDNSTLGGAYVGAIATIPLGVRAVGTAGNETGSLGMTYLGALAGGLGGLLMLANGRDNITALGMILAPPLGAVIGFNSSRRYKPRRVRVYATGALVSWSDGDGASLGVPLPTRTRWEDRAGTVTSIPLLGGTF